MGFVILIVAGSPSFMVRMAISHPRIIVPLSAIMRCQSDRANDGRRIISLLLSLSSLLSYVDGTMVQEYFTTIASLVGSRVRSLRRWSFWIRPMPPRPPEKTTTTTTMMCTSLRRPWKTEVSSSMELPTLHNYVLVQYILLKRQL